MKNLSKIALTALLASGMMCAAQSTDQNAGASASSSGSAKASKTSKSGGADAAFAKKAAIGGMAEVQLGKLATTNAESNDVKQFGQRMVDDHSKANDQLKQAAQQANIDLPTDVDAKHKAEADRLSKLNGAAFDKAYMKLMVQDHVKDVNEFKKEANSGKNDAIKSFAQQTEPTLEDHLKMAKQVNGTVNGSASSKATSKKKGKSSDASSSTSGTK